MRRFLISACVALLALLAVSPGRAHACWYSRVHTMRYADPCVSCGVARNYYAPPVIERSYYVPEVVTRPYYAPSSVIESHYYVSVQDADVPPPATAAPPPPVCLVPRTTCRTACTTTNVERWYLQPQTTYTTRTQLEPQTTFVRRSYYDPLGCCYHSYLEPTTQYVERSYMVPETRYVRRCTTEPVTTCAPICTTNYVLAPGVAPPADNASEPGRSDYSPQAPQTPNDVVPGTAPRNSEYPPASPQRGSRYPPSDEPKKPEASPDAKASPEPYPMPAKQRGDSTRAAPGARRAGRGVLTSGAPVRLVR